MCHKLGQTNHAGHRDFWDKLGHGDFFWPRDISGHKLGRTTKVTVAFGVIK